MCGFHLSSLLFAALAKLPVSHRSRSHETSGAEQPADENRARPQCAGFPSQHDKHCLGDLLRQMRIPRLAQSGRINQPGMTLQKTAKSLFRSFHSVAAKKFSVLHHNSIIESRARGKRDKFSPGCTSKP